MREQWKTIEGYHHYQVSNCGRVRAIGHWANGKPEIVPAKSEEDVFKLAGLRYLLPYERP